MYPLTRMILEKLGQILSAQLNPPLWMLEPEFCQPRETLVFLLF